MSKTSFFNCSCNISYSQSSNNVSLKVSSLLRLEFHIQIHFSLMSFLLPSSFSSLPSTPSSISTSKFLFNFMYYFGIINDSLPCLHCAQINATSFSIYVTHHDSLLLRLPLQLIKFSSSLYLQLLTSCATVATPQIYHDVQNAVLLIFLIGYCV